MEREIMKEELVILRVDMQGYKELMEKDHDIAVRLSTVLNNITEEIVNFYNSSKIISTSTNRKIKDTGDGSYSVFKSAYEAIKAARDIMKRVEDYNLDKEENEKLKIRIALDKGIVSFIKDDVKGNPLNFTNLMKKEIMPGEIGLTEDVLKDIPNTGDLPFPTYFKVFKERRIYLYTQRDIITWKVAEASFLKYKKSLDFLKDELVNLFSAMEEERVKSFKELSTEFNDLSRIIKNIQNTNKTYLERILEALEEIKEYNKKSLEINNQIMDKIEEQINRLKKNQKLNFVTISIVFITLITIIFLLLKIL